MLASQSLLRLSQISGTHEPGVQSSSTLPSQSWSTRSQKSGTPVSGGAPSSFLPSQSSSFWLQRSPGLLHSRLGGLHVELELHSGCEQAESRCLPGTGGQTAPAQA